MSILHTIANQPGRDAQIKAWLKPRLKLQNGFWECTGRGATAKGHCPEVAYTLWMFAVQPNVIYASGGIAA